MVKFRQKQDNEQILYDSAKSKLDGFIKNCEKFKIGKTGQTLKERFNQYLCDEDDFNSIECLYQSESKDVISKLESSLIDAYINDSKCQNLKDASRVKTTVWTLKLKYILFMWS